VYMPQYISCDVSEFLAFWQLEKDYVFLFKASSFFENLLFSFLKKKMGFLAAERRLCLVVHGFVLFGRHCRQHFDECESTFTPEP